MGSSIAVWGKTFQACTSVVGIGERPMNRVDDDVTQVLDDLATLTKPCIYNTFEFYSESMR
jgi:hypothetical protein